MQLARNSHPLSSSFRKRAKVYRWRDSTPGGVRASATIGTTPKNKIAKVPFGHGTKSVSVGMSDPRNVAHKKKITQEKHHQEVKAAAKSPRGSKSPDVPQNQPSAETAKAEQQPGDLEKSLAVLSKLKEMEFHSRANIETLAQLILTIEE